MSHVAGVNISLVQNLSVTQRQLQLDINWIDAQMSLFFAACLAIMQTLLIMF
jgi:hypothetical protein